MNNQPVGEGQHFAACLVKVSFEGKPEIGKNATFWAEHHYGPNKIQIFSFLNLHEACLE